MNTSPSARMSNTSPTKFDELLAALGAEHTRLQQLLRSQELENKFLRAKLADPSSPGLSGPLSINAVPALGAKLPQAPGSARYQKLNVDPVRRIVSMDDLINGVISIPDPVKPDIYNIGIHDSNANGLEHGVTKASEFEVSFARSPDSVSALSQRSSNATTEHSDTPERGVSGHSMSGRHSHRVSFSNARRRAEEVSRHSRPSQRVSFCKVQEDGDDNQIGRGLGDDLGFRSVKLGISSDNVEGGDKLAIPGELDGLRPEKANERQEDERSSKASKASNSSVPLTTYSATTDQVGHVGTTSTVMGHSETRQSGSHGAFPELWPIWREAKKSNYQRRKSKRMHTQISFERSTGNLLLQSGGIVQKLVVRPNSNKRLMWDLISILMVSYDVVTIPLAVFEMSKHVITDTMNWVTTAYWTLDLPCSFLTGFHSGGAIEMRPWVIARTYLLSWFFFDFAVVCADWVFIVYELNSLNNGGGDSTGLVRISKAGGRVNRMFRAVRLIRFLKLQRLMAEVLQLVKSQYVHTMCTIGLSVVLIVVFNHYLACGWYWVGKENQKDGTVNWIDQSKLYVDEDYYKYSTALHWSLTQFTPASMEVRPYNIHERIYSICVLFFALVTFSSFLGSITNAMSQLRRLQSDHTNEQISLRRFFAENKVSAELGQRIYRFLKNTHFSHRTRMMKEDCPCLQLLSGTLRRELNTELHRPYVTKNVFFYHFSGVNAEGVADVCDQTIGERSFFSKDEIFTDSQELNKMFFLTSGRGNYTRFTYTMVNGSEDMRTSVELVQEGSWISEPALWLQWTTVGQLFAATSCEILFLDTMKFLKVAQDWEGTSMRFVRGYVKHFVAYMLNEQTWMSDLWMNLDELHRIVQRAQNEVGEKSSSRMPRHLKGDAMTKRHSFGTVSEVNYGRMFSRRKSDFSNITDSDQRNSTFESGENE